MNAIPVLVERHGERLHISARAYLGPDQFDLFRKTVKMLGASWAQSSRAWTMACTMENCRELRESFGEGLEIGPALWTWAAAERARERDLATVADLDMSTSVELPRVKKLAPTMWKAMQDKGYQPIAALWGARAGHHLNADDQGLGKSIEAMAALIERGITGRVLVVVHGTTPVRSTWLPQLRAWLGDVDGGLLVATPGMRETASGSVVSTSAAQREQAIREFNSAAGGYRFAFCVINGEMARAVKVITYCPMGSQCNGRGTCPEVRRHKTKTTPKLAALFDIEWDGIIADEVHKMIANPKTQISLGLKLLRLRYGGMRIALSGTPRRGRTRNLFAPLSFLYPERYRSQWKWMESYLDYVANPFTQSGKQFLDTVRADRREAFDRELASVMIRRTKDDLYRLNPAWAPPPKTYVHVWVDMSDKQAKAYRSMESTADAEMSNGKLSATGILAQTTRLRQLACGYGAVVNTDEGQHFRPQLPSSKFDWLVDFLAERGITGNKDTEDGDNKVVVAGQWTEFIELWDAELRRRGIETFVLTGKTKMERREEMTARFQESGGPRVFLLNTFAGGVSITLDAADDIVIMDETWMPDDQRQVEDRVHRTSNVEHYVNVYVVRTRGTIESEVSDVADARATADFEYLDVNRLRAWAAKHGWNPPMKGGR